MSDVSDLFCVNDTGTPIEGYLSDNEACEVLFVLREPNTKGYNNTTGEFWMRSVVSGEKRYLGEKYVNTLGTVAALLLGEDLTESGKIKALKRCAYINVYPFSGKGRAGERYYKTLEQLAALQSEADFTDVRRLNSINDQREYRIIAENRIEIINRMPCKYVVTVCGAFEAIVGKKAEECCYGIIAPKKKFRIAEKNDKKIVAYYHPGARVDHGKIDVSRVFEYDVLRNQ